jgi:putative endonuclease
VRSILSELRAFFVKFKNLGAEIRRVFRRELPRNIRLGRLGESIASKYLKRKGLRILGKNVVLGNGEIDIVAFDVKNEILIFVEVKLRADGALVPGYFAVDARKKNILRRTCMAYIRKFSLSQISHRFDIVEVGMDKATGKHSVSHYEGVKLFS